MDLLSRYDLEVLYVPGLHDDGQDTLREQAEIEIELAFATLSDRLRERGLLLVMENDVATVVAA
jgi:ferritin-like protein